MKTRVHISIEVNDIESSVQFYSNLFDQAPTKVKSDYANFRLDEPAIHLALVKTAKEGRKRTGNEHFGIELFSSQDLVKWHNHVKAKNMENRPEEGIVCCYAKSDKFWVKDPDGHEWEFWLRTEEATSMHETNSKSACCAPGQCG
jgi:predicted lactoylglutathione lyase